jgi:hypothetical protein
MLFFPVLPFHVMKLNGGVEVKFHVLLISELDRGE